MQIFPQISFRLNDKINKNTKPKKCFPHEYVLKVRTTDSSMRRQPVIFPFFLLSFSRAVVTFERRKRSSGGPGFRPQPDRSLKGSFVSVIKWLSAFKPGPQPRTAILQSALSVRVNETNEGGGKTISAIRSVY